MGAGEQSLPSLPDTAVEAIHTRLSAEFEPSSDGLDPTRHVLPLVNKQWNRCSRLWPLAHSKVSPHCAEATALLAACMPA